MKLENFLISSKHQISVHWILLPLNQISHAGVLLSISGKFIRLKNGYKTVTIPIVSARQILIRRSNKCAFSTLTLIAALSCSSSASCAASAANTHSGGSAYAGPLVFIFPCGNVPPACGGAFSLLLAGNRGYLWIFLLLSGHFSIGGKGSGIQWVTSTRYAGAVAECHPPSGPI